MAIACFRPFTRPPLPPGPDFNVPLFRRRIALFTDLLAPRPYLAISPSLNNLHNYHASTLIYDRALISMDFVTQLRHESPPKLVNFANPSGCLSTGEEMSNQGN
jgi:hypothetical protein